MGHGMTGAAQFRTFSFSLSPGGVTHGVLASVANPLDRLGHGVARPAQTRTVPVSRAHRITVWASSHCSMAASVWSGTGPRHRRPSR